MQTDDDEISKCTEDKQEQTAQEKKNKFMHKFSGSKQI